MSLSARAIILQEINSDEETSECDSDEDLEAGEKWLK